jgi:hypothetical protein
MIEQKDYNLTFVFLFFAADPEGPGFCAFVLTFMAAMLLVITLPFSLCTCIKVNSLRNNFKFKAVVINCLFLLISKLV